LAKIVGDLGAYSPQAKSQKIYLSFALAIKLASKSVQWKETPELRTPLSKDTSV